MRSNQHSWSVCLCRAFKIRVSGLQSLPTSCDMKRSWKYTRAVLVAIESASGGFSTPFTKKNIKWTLCHATGVITMVPGGRWTWTPILNMLPRILWAAQKRTFEANKPRQVDTNTGTSVFKWCNNYMYIYIHGNNMCVHTDAATINTHAYFFRGTQ